MSVCLLQQPTGGTRALSFREAAVVSVMERVLGFGLLQ